jgi:hypothetical protein
MPEPAFLLLEDILFIHQQEIKVAGGEPNIRRLLCDAYCH